MRYARVPAATPPLDPLSEYPAVRHWLHRLHQADEARPWLLDSVVALFVLLFGLASVFPRGPSDDSFVAIKSAPTAFVVVTAVAQSLPLIWRRRAPLAVFAIILAVCMLQISARVALRSDLGLMVALYEVARSASLRLPGLVCAGGSILAATILAIIRVPTLAQLRLFGLFAVTCVITASIALGLAARARHAKLMALADRAAQMEVEREQRARLAAADERARVSREMHDIIGHNIAVIVSLADGGASQAETKPERSAEILRMIAATGRQALRELRLTLGALRETPQTGSENPDLRPQPGTADLADLIGRTGAAGPHIRYVTAGDLDALEPGMQLTIYRIVQEALTNTLKHAGTATSILVELAVRDHDVQVTVDDTGGLSARPAADWKQPDGRGLIGIRERAALAGGTARAEPRPGGGWSVLATLPLPGTREPA
jgi:signal transduction histidine kinase